MGKRRDPVIIFLHIHVEGHGNHVPVDLTGIRDAEPQRKPGWRSRVERVSDRLLEKVSYETLIWIGNGSLLYGPALIESIVRALS